VVGYSICTLTTVQIETMLVYPTMMVFGAAWTAVMCYAVKANLEDDYLARQ
jgi:hypothetical protein